MKIILLNIGKLGITFGLNEIKKATVIYAVHLIYTDRQSVLRIYQCRTKFQ